MEAQNKAGQFKGEIYINNKNNLEWRPITGFEEQYEVSNYGDFHILPYQFIDKANRNIVRKERYIWSEELSLYGGRAGKEYLGIHLGGMKKTYAHILAAKEFCPNPYNKPQVNHKDGNHKNNYCGCFQNLYQDSNLEWTTAEENSRHASKNNLINRDSEARKRQCKRNREKVDYKKIVKPVIQFDLNGIIVNEYDSIAEASKKTGICYSNIRAVASNIGYHKTAGGFIWTYKHKK